ncbi:hypothetical protein SLA2020_340520 [Shorea laevis]
MLIGAKVVVVFGLMALALPLFPVACLADFPDACLADCVPSFCGNLSISCPFRLKSDPIECGRSEFELACENNRATWLTSTYGKSFVEKISYDNRTVTLVDASLRSSICSIPRSILLRRKCWSHGRFRDITDNNIMYVLNCNMPMSSSLYVDASNCTSSSSSPHTYLFLFNNQTKLSDFNESCRIEAQFPVMLSNISGLAASDIYLQMLMGFELDWDSFYDSFLWCGKLTWREIWEQIRQFFTYNVPYSIERILQGDKTYFYDNYDDSDVLFLELTGGFILARALLGLSILIAVIVYKFYRRHLSADNAIEEFLQKQNNFMPIKYSYPEIKKMTRGFKDKLGEGGYGLVFKGKLRSGNLVAIKLLSKSKANGQDFINEVATIGRVHHVNVVRLIGFCVEGSKRALVYDFMPNGSLDKIIFSGENSTSLTCQRMFEIALGVARGIEYLHRGCEMQILHFDIKPHNILLDENFNPKVSDFGLAKLYPIDDSIVSLTTARGTLGYMAPELFYKNIGGVSYKADVYSFGMLLMEMVGRRRNINAFADHTSQIYFPKWISERFDQGGDIELGDVTDVEKNVLMKMAIVALWCIQMKPAIRPSMTKVLEMLESEIELLEMPPKPTFVPSESPAPNHGGISLATAPTMSLDARS